MYEPEIMDIEWKMRQNGKQICNIDIAESVVVVFAMQRLNIQTEFKQMFCIKWKQLSIWYPTQNTNKLNNKNK